MAKKNYKYQYNGINLRSKEEVEFLQWLIEAKNNDYVIEYKYEPKTFILAPAKWHGKTHLLHKQAYTPDFFISFTDKFNQFSHGLHLQNNSCYVDVKGTYTKGFANSSAYTFPILQKWLYDKYNIFVNKIVVRDNNTKKGFFSKTFVPEILAYNKRNPLLRNKSFLNCKLLKEIKHERFL